MSLIFHGKKPGRKPRPFESFVRLDPSGCHIWIGGKSSSGYGTCGNAEKSRKAHHVAYERAYGPLPKSRSGHQDFVIMHLCDNRLCVNPSHLKLGSQLENIKDRQDKRRQARRGANHRWNKITPECLERIKEAYLFGAIGTDLANIYGVAHSVIYRILRQDRSAQPSV
jgi:hypothetical protein